MSCEPIFFCNYLKYNYFWIKYFHLICHLILTKINCITLKIRSKADFKSKSQNIWQQIILFSSTANDIYARDTRFELFRGDYRSCAMFSWWNIYIYIYIPCVPKLNLEYGGTFTKLFMHASSRNMFPTIKNLLKKMSNASKNIFRVYHIRIIAPKQKWFTRHETDRFLNNHCQECVRAYLSIHDCLSFLHEVMIGNHRNKTSRAYHLHYCPGRQNYLLSNILRFALKICFWADFWCYAVDFS
jgi:hypothetical protein